MKVKEVDHICFAVRSVEQARKVYEGVMGMQPAFEYTAEQEGIRVVRYYVGSVAIEIMEPTNSTCEVARFLDRNGEGFYLIAYKVDDVKEALNELNKTGIQTIDVEPRRIMGARYAFIQPSKAFHGVMTEIIDGEFIRPGTGEREVNHD